MNELYLLGLKNTAIIASFIIGLIAYIQTHQAKKTTLLDFILIITMLSSLIALVFINLIEEKIQHTENIKKLEQFEKTLYNIERTLHPMKIEKVLIYHCFPLDALPNNLRVELDVKPNLNKKLAIKNELKNKILKELNIDQEQFKFIIASSDTTLDTLYQNKKQTLVRYNFTNQNRVQKTWGGLFLDRNKGICFEKYYNIENDKMSFFSAQQSPFLRSILDLEEKKLFVVRNEQISKLKNMNVEIDYIYMLFGNGGERTIREFKKKETKNRYIRSGIGWEFSFPKNIRKWLSL